MTIKQLSIFVENKKGTLCKITKILADNSIDIRALSIADTSDFGILRLIVNNPEKAIDLLKNNNITVRLTDVIAVSITDEPGGFSNIVSILAQNEVEIEYMYAFLERNSKRAFIILRLENVINAVKILKEEKIEVLEEKDIYNM